jgi:hypothetical protein
VAFGIQVIGDAGNVQVDQDFVTMAFLAKGSITLDQEQIVGVTPTLNDAWLSSTGAAASAAGGLLCAFRARDASRPVGVWSTSGSGSSTQFVGYSTSTNPPIVDWWIFGRPPVESTQFGAEVYDASGARVWSSAGKPMKIAAAKNDVVLDTDGAISAGTGDYAVCVGYPLGGVRSGTETPISGGAFAWIEARAMWSTPTSTGFAKPSPYNARRLESFSYPTGWRSQDIRATVLLVDVAGL